MCKIDFENMSMSRKIVVTVAGGLYALALLGNLALGHGLATIFGVTIFFVISTAIVMLWVK